ncbi:hypothetical protein ACRAWF_36790 [Streptomyces sp. L7]
MSNGLVRLSDGHLVFGEAVSRIAESLNPLGAAARLVAESYALTTEMRRINLEKTQAADSSRRSPRRYWIQRRRESSTMLRQQQQELGHADTSAQSLRECMVNMQRETVKPGLASEERIAYVELTKHFTTTARPASTRNRAGGLAVALDQLLNGAGATALAPDHAMPDHSGRQHRGSGSGDTTPGRRLALQAVIAGDEGDGGSLNCAQQS